MWTFERYQRWMDQVSDWVRPPAPAALHAQGEPRAPRSAPPLRRQAAPAPRPLPGAAPPAAPPAAPARPAAGTGAARPSAGGAASGEEIIEVPAEEMDLAALAELAKKVVEKKP